MSSDNLYRIVLTSIAAAVLVSLLGGREEPRPRQPPPDPEPILFAQPLSPPAEDDDCTPRSECCRVCDKGKACGDSCISRKLTCRKDDGCACDEADVCTSAS